MSADDLTSNDLVEAAKFAADVLAELYAKHGTKIGPFASQAQKANALLGAALRAAVEPDEGPYTGKPKEHARDVHYQLIEHFGLTDTPTANYAVRQMLLALTRHPEPPDDDRLAEREQLLFAVSDWISSAPHGDNCFVTDEYPGNQCVCGKDALVRAMDDEFGVDESSVTKDATP